MDFLSDNVVFEQVLMQCNETFVYKVPPLSSASGYRAESFGLDNPLFTGHLKVVQADEKLRISLYRYKDEKTLLTTPENLVLFGECPIQIEPKGDLTPFVDGVADSSRYFVIRIKDPSSSRSVSLGIGFRERETAFDFKSSLNEYVRYIDRMATAEEMAKEQEDLLGSDKEEDKGPVKQMKDMSLKEGEKIHVKGVGGKNRRHHGGQSSGGLQGLKPPPPAGSVVHVKNPNTSNSDTSSAPTNVDESSEKSAIEDEDWGDFASFS